MVHELSLSPLPLGAIDILGGFSALLDKVLHSWRGKFLL